MSEKFYPRNAELNQTAYEEMFVDMVQTLWFPYVMYHLMLYVYHRNGTKMVSKYSLKCTSTHWHAHRLSLSWCESLTAVPAWLQAHWNTISAFDLSW